MLELYRGCILGPQVISFVERFIVLCPYLGKSTIRGSTADCTQHGGGDSQQRAKQRQTNQCQINKVRTCVRSHLQQPHDYNRQFKGCFSL